MSGTLEANPFYNDFRAVLSQNEELFGLQFRSFVAGFFFTLLRWLLLRSERGKALREP